MNYKSWAQTSEWPLQLKTKSVKALPTVINERKSLLWGAQILVREKGKQSIFDISYVTEKSDFDTQHLILCINPHLVKHWYYNCQSELRPRQPPMPAESSSIFLGREQALFPDSSRLHTKVTTFSIITLQWLAKFISPRNILNSPVRF